MKKSKKKLKKQLIIPACKEQKEFEDLAETLLDVAAELPTEKTIDLLEFAYTLLHATIQGN